MTVLFDSSAWFAYVGDNSPVVRGIVDSGEEIFVSVISLFEIKRVLLKRGVQVQKIEKTLSFVRSRCRVFDVTRDIADFAAELSFKHGLSTADALIYASARSRNAELITGDDDFRGMKGVKIVE